MKFPEHVPLELQNFIKILLESKDIPKETKLLIIENMKIEANVVDMIKNYLNKGKPLIFTQNRISMVDPKEEWKPEVTPDIVKH